MKRFIYRILLFQFLFLFSYFKYSKYDNSVKDFKKRILKFSYLSGPQISNYISSNKNKLETLFPYFLVSMPVLGFLSILNFKFFQVLSGVLTFYIALLYVNPLQRIQNNFYKNPFGGWKNYIPSNEFTVIVILALAMISYAFYYDKYNYYSYKIEKNEKKEKQN